MCIIVSIHPSSLLYYTEILSTHPFFPFFGLLFRSMIYGWSANEEKIIRDKKKGTIKKNVVVNTERCDTINWHSLCTQGIRLGYHRKKNETDQPKRVLILADRCMYIFLHVRIFWHTRRKRKTFYGTSEWCGQGLMCWENEMIGYDDKNGHISCWLFQRMSNKWFGKWNKS